MEKVTVKAFSTSANLGPGYDILALAHNAFQDELIMEKNPNSPYGTIKIIADGVPEEVEKNSAGLSLLNLFHQYGIKESVRIQIRKHVPIGAGLGGSGCSSASSVAAANELLDLGSGKDELLKFAMEGEAAASGAPHPDNVAASIYGNLVAVNSVNPPGASNVKIGLDIGLLSIIPDVQISGKTRMARSMIPKTVSIEDHVQSSRNLTSLIAGFMTGKRELIRNGMNDGLVETSRLSMFPYYTAIRENALKNNAVGVCVSGAGPTILVIYDQETNLNAIEEGVKQVMKGHNISFRKAYSVPCGGMEIE